MTTVLALAAFLAVVLSPGAAPAQLPAGQVILDNPSVRVTIFTLPPSVGTGRHQGIEAELGIVIEGDVTVESPLGRTMLRPGTAYWVPGLTPHDARNDSQRPARMLEILLKRCD